MAATHLEKLRSAHEDIETLERAIRINLTSHATSHREHILQEHRVAAYVSKAHEIAKQLTEDYKDSTGAGKEELDAMTSDQCFQSFYSQLTSIREYHARFPDIVPYNPIQVVDDCEPTVTFTGEEGWGRYVDLHDFHARYCNFEGARRVDYMRFLDMVRDFSSLPMSAKNESYRQYVKDLVEYLLGFFRRIKPLVPLDELMQEAKVAFERKWREGSIPGWEDALGSADGEFFCEPCGRKFAKQTVYDAHRASQKHIKTVERLTKAGQTNGSNGSTAPAGVAAAAAPVTSAAGGASTAAVVGDSNTGVDFGVRYANVHQQTAWLEAVAAKLFSLLSSIMDATKQQVLKKQTRTVEELAADTEQAEIEVAEEEEEESDDEDEKLPYNPKNLPVGWDGKPIPYWLFKLHGLGVEYKCEICGNYSYWGRRAFDRHFREWRHAHGMRCLRIPNTKHFHDIILIQDAVDLYEKIKGSLETETWQPENDEEFEDSEGHVLSRKTWEDMVRQGVL